MKLSFMLMLGLTLGTLGLTSGAGAAETYHASASNPTSRAHYHGPDSPDPCVENYYSPGSINPCEKYYAPRKSVDPSEISPTTGPLYERNCNELRSRKLFRGIANVTLALGEIPAGAFREAYATSPVTGTVVGGANGVVTAVRRIGLGVFEIMTFPFPMHQKPTGESMLASDGVNPDPEASATRFDFTCAHSRKSVDGCCNRTQGTFDPYIEPEVVWMDVLPPAGE